MKYRPDIDGLRAIAVTSVILGHAGVPYLTGGYVGVDVFFVISGYLITSILLRELDEKRFSIAGFYERRIRRIFPALMTVLVFVLGLSLALASSQEQAQISKSTLAALGFVSNLFFWQQSGYFDVAATTKPLLHTWSLAVEEQFYLLFPLFLWLLRDQSRRRIALASVVVAASSLALSVYGARVFPSFAFYGAPTRAWELMLGSVLALGLVPPFRKRASARVALLVGAACIVAAVLTLDEQSAFPGYLASLPCVGAALMIHGGRVLEDGDFAPTGGWLFRANTFGPWVHVGLLSYSLYLWHWPLLVFWRIIRDQEPPLPEKLAALGLALVLADLSWRFVEAPFRQHGESARRARVFAAGFGAAVVVAGLCIPAILADPVRMRALYLASGEILDDPEEEARRLEAYVTDVNPRRESTLAFRDFYISPEDAPLFGAEVRPRYALWGDSHGDPLAYELGERLAVRGESLRAYTYLGNLPLAGTGRNDDPRAGPWCDAVLQHIVDDPGIEVVFLVGRWTVYVHDRNTSLGIAEPVPLPWRITDAQGNEVPFGPPMEALFRRQLEFTLRRMLEAGKTVVLVYPPPETGYIVGRALGKLARAGKPYRDFVVPRDIFFDRHRFVLETFDELELGPQLERVRIYEPLLDETQTIVYANERVLYADDNHLSLSGARFVLPLFEPYLRPEADAG